MSRAKAICSGVYAVGGPGLSSPEDACAYLVDASTSLVLIDAGVGYGINRMEDNIRSTGGQPESVWHIIATHCHIDHIGGLFAWKERYGCKIIAHEMDRAGIEGERPDLTAAGMYGVDYRPVNVDMLLSGEGGTVRLGEVDFHFLAYPRPHSRKHLHLYRQLRGEDTLRPGYSRAVLPSLGLRHIPVAGVHGQAAGSQCGCALRGACRDLPRRECEQIHRVVFEEI